MLSTKRTVYFDYLRVFATFAVIILHVSSRKFYSTDVNGFAWQVFNFFDAIVRWSVPVFVMISGALFLNREIPIKKLYSKYILRILTAFLVWSAIYAAFEDGGITERIVMLIHGHYHMWFLFMIATTYMCIPLIKPIVENGKRTKYYLLLAFLFAFVYPTALKLAGDFAGERINLLASAINDDVNSMNRNPVLGYTAYFVLGYCLNKATLSTKQRTAIYLLGIVGFVSTIALNSVASLKAQACSTRYYDEFCVNVLLESVAVFTFFKGKSWNSDKFYPIVLKLSKYSFGAFLVHPLVIEQLDVRLGLNTLSFHPVLSVISIAMLVCLASFSVSAILNHIPILKKFVV